MLVGVIVYSMRSTTIKVFPIALTPLESVGTSPEIGLAVPSRKADHLKPLFAGLIAATMELPDSLVTKWTDIATEFEEADQADCRYFAQLYRKAQFPDSGSRWNTEPIRITDDRLDTPGATLVYTRASQESDSIAVHWAISCGAKYVIQAFGVGEPLIITPRTTPFTMYDVNGLSLATPSSSHTSSSSFPPRK